MFEYLSQNSKWQTIISSSLIFFATNNSLKYSFCA